MARIIYTALVAGIKGSINGSVIQASAGGDQVRNRVRPFDPRNQYQTPVRTAFSEISKLWVQMTDADRATWSGATVPGEQQKTAFMRSNLNLSAAGQPYVTAYFASSVPVGIPVRFTTLGVNVMVVNATNTPGIVPANCYLIVYVTDSLSPAQQTLSPGMLGIVLVFGPGTDLVLPNDIILNYLQFYQNPIVGRRIFVRTKIVDSTNGLAAIGGQYSQIVP